MPTTWISRGVVPALPTLYVTTSGNDANSGSSTSPFRTIPRAIAVAEGPTLVLVGPGTYPSFIVSKPGLIISSAVRHGATIFASGGNPYGTIQISANYVTVDGFTVDGSGGYEHGIVANSVHHAQVNNCRVHSAPGSGIAFAWGEFFHAKGNEVWNCARGGWFSGITIYQARAVSDGDFAGWPGVRNYIGGNRCWDNYTSFGSTDGNGILIDDWDHTQSYGPDPALWLGVEYPHGCLVENNLTHGNGNKGVGVAWAQNCIVRHNTCYDDGVDGSQGTWRGMVSNQSGRNNTFVNNIGVANSARTGQSAYNTGGGNYSTGDLSCAGTVFKNNLFRDLNATGSISFNHDGPGTGAADGTNIYADPQFAGANYQVSTGSPCVNGGTAAYGVPATDFLGVVRSGTPDIGCYDGGI